MYKILYVDDEESLLDICKQYLESTREFSVDTALSAKEGLHELEQSHYDAVLADYMMPEMDGIEFLKQVRSKYGCLPFILFTGRGREEVVIEAINNGADFYLQKGGDPRALFAELIHKIKKAIEANRQKEDLEKSETWFRSIIQNSNDFVIVVNKTGAVVYSSPGSVKMLGYPENYLIGKNPLELVHPDDLDFVRSRLDEAYKKDHIPPPTSYRVRKADGTYIHVESMSSNLLDVPSVGGIVITTRDITERKSAEDALNEERKFIESILENLPGVFYVLDEQGLLIKANKSYYKLSGYTEKELLNTSSLARIAEEDRDFVKEKIREVFMKGSVSPAVARILTKDGRKIPHLITGFTISVEGKRYIGGVGIDISKSVKVREELRDCHKRLETMKEELRRQREQVSRNIRASEPAGGRNDNE